MVIALIPVFILALLIGLFYENGIEKYFYKLIGGKRRPAKEKNRYPNLPSSISVISMWNIDNIEDTMKNKYGFSEDELDSIDFIQIKSSKNIEGLYDYLFDPDIIMFNNDVFLNKISLLDYNWSLCYIDVKNLTFYEFPNSNVKLSRKYTEAGNTLTMKIRGYLTKQTVTLKYSS